MRIYQPNRQGYQPKKEYISQTDKDISQKKNISAKPPRISAKKKKNISAKPTRISVKKRIYQPNQQGYRPK